MKKISENEFEVWIKEKPIDGRANSYLEKVIKKYTGRKYRIVSGLSSRIKILELLD